MDARDERPVAPRGAPSRTVSRRRYRARRLGALLAVFVIGGVVVYSAVRAASEFFGDDGGAAGAVVEPTAAPDGSSDDGTDGDDAPTSTDDGSETSVASTTEPVDDNAPVSQSNPASVLIIGDSDAGTFGPYLQTLLDGTQHADTTLDYKVSSGLARPDFFDWPTEAENKLAEVDPDIVVATFGGNDSQALTDLGGGVVVGLPENNETEWTAEYVQRAGDMMDQLTAGGRTLIWVGIPNDDNPDVSARLAIQDNAVRAAAADRPDVIFVDTWERFSGRDGNWAEFVIDPRDGEGKDVRADDGFHLNETGAEILALDIAQEVRDVLRDLGAQI
ncbi:MAG: DUF459 domain-containing protein [Ilumatobacteraceae bacterium]|nr:DUF459 domain-containing protein [Ilumatobacteraceae bacterium]